MNSTSDQMTQPSKKTRLIIDEIGVDTETGIIGRGHSYDNGKTFTVDKTIYGRIFHKGDYDQVWKGIQDQVAKVVAPAKSAANSAVSAADAAVASAQVTSYAVSAVASATAEAKQGANEAMSRAESAWGVATSATNAASSAQSDAKQVTSSVAALLTSVDTLKGNVTDLQAESTMQASEIKNKVTQSDVTGMLTGYATQDYTQSLVTQKADDWNLNLTKLKNDTQTSVTNLSATVDGIKSTVATKADQSTVTELSNLVQTKVSSGDFTSTTTQLKDEINQRVQVGDVISQINQEAGGNTLIQVSNGNGSLILNAGNTIITGKAWIPSAALADLTADDITTGTLKGVDIDFRNASGQGVLIKDSTVTFDDGAGGNKAGYISFSSMPIADWPSGTGGNELQIKYGESLALLATGDTNSRALFSTVDTQIGYHQQGDTSANWGLTGLKIDNANRQINLGAYGSDGKWSRFLANSGSTELNVDATHCTMDGGKLHFYKDNDNNSSIAVELQVDGWAWVRGWVEAAGHSQHSTLSSKTRIEEADPDYMLDLVNNTDLTTFAFKSEVAEGLEVRHIGPIIDDVNDVAKYKIPSEFIAPTKTARDDDNMIGALFGAVQALTKRIKTLESRVG